MFDRLFQKVPWWAVSSVLHVVLLVQAITFGARLPVGGEEEFVNDPAGGTDLDLRLQAPGIPEFGLQPAMKPHEPEEETVFRDLEEEGTDDGFV